MTLRRKLLITFGTLAFLGLAIAGVSVWVTLQWESTNEELRRHYMRSLEAQRVRAATFRATKEVSDIIAEGDPQARQEFDRATQTAEQDLDAWSALAGTEAERRQVREVRSAYERVVADADRVFELVEAGRPEEAIALADEQLQVRDAVPGEDNGTQPPQQQPPPQPDDDFEEPDDDFEEDDELEGSGAEVGRYELVGFVQEGPAGSSFEAFEAATDRAVASDRDVRQVIRERTESTRRTAQLVLIVASFGTVSLLLLLAAYLVSDLFRPLRDLKQALEDLEKGDFDHRLDEDRADELGEVSRAFNRAADAISRRERMERLVAAPSDGGGDGGSSWRSAPSRVTLHRLVSQLRSRISQLNETENGRDGYANEQGELASQLDQLSQAVARMTDFGFPLDLNLSRTDIRALLYRVFMRFQDELAERGVSIELSIAPEVGYAVVDRLKLREAVGELLQNALSALPESGGQLGLRSRPSEDGTELLIEVADDGAGAEQSLIDDAFDPEAFGPDDRPRVGLALTNAIVEQHGGRLLVESEPGGGAYAQIRLPLRD
jgi:two-component system, OmpR family, sensor kinase